MTFAIAAYSFTNSLLRTVADNSHTKKMRELILQELKTHCPSLESQQHELIVSYITTFDSPPDNAHTMMQTVMCVQTVALLAISTMMGSSSSRAENFPRLSQGCCNHFIPPRMIDCSKDALTRLCEDPHQFYEEIDQHRYFRNSWPFDKNLLSLTLCSCPKISPVLREFTSKASLEQLTELRSHDKESFLTLLSVGTGGGYHELAYAIVPFAQAGFNKMRMVCIDKSPEISRITHSMMVFCRSNLPKCDITFHLFDSIEAYASSTQDFTFFRPNFLLLLDLTDDAYYIKGQSFRDYSFTFLQKEGLLSSGTVIVYSAFEETTPTQAMRTAICCTYDGTSTNLEDIVPRKEQIEILKGEALQSKRTWKLHESWQKQKP